MNYSNKNDFVHKIEQYSFMMAVKRALINIIPIIMIGSFSLALRSMPIPIYQKFIENTLNGFICKVLESGYNVTYGIISIYMVICIAYQIGQIKSSKLYDHRFGIIMVCLITYFIFAGKMDITNCAYGPEGMFISIIASFIASKIYIWVSENISDNNISSKGFDPHLKNSISAIIPVAITCFFFIAVNFFVLKFFNVKSIYELIIMFTYTLFTNIKVIFVQGLLYVFLINFLWFFGIHGNDVLEGAASTIFDTNLNTNVKFVSEHIMSNEIVTKQFINSFVLLGGCGATISIIIAILILKQYNNNRKIAQISLFPMIFNINEIIVFGLPIVFNVNFIIPFIGVPLLNYIIAYVAIYTGLVPLTVKTVEWTTPVFLSAYLATNSWKGVILQIINIIVGTIIYIPFIKKSELYKKENEIDDYSKMVDVLKESEITRVPVNIIDNISSYGMLAKAIAIDIEKAIVNKKITLYYQPQCHADGYCTGAEALIRFEYAPLGVLYPPLIFKLAQETGILEKLEELIFESVVEDARVLKETYPDKDIKLSVNVTGITIQKNEFEEFLLRIANNYNINELNICIEITEQDTLNINDDLYSRFVRIKQMGYLLSVDDFSMGSTSIQYISGNSFDYLKLDGQLVSNSITNPRCCEIISSIIRLCENLDIKVIAEYISNKEIKDKIEGLGCYIYQGWYYSKAITFDEFLKYIKNK